MSGDIVSMIMATDDEDIGKGVESARLLHDMLTQTSTPGHRFFAVAGIVTSIYTALADGVAKGTVTREQAVEASRLIDSFKPLFEDPPANFVEMLATLHNLIEETKRRDDLDEKLRLHANALQQYLHSIAFTPSAEVPRTPEEITTDLAGLASFVKEFKQETDRGAALVGAALIDHHLERLLRGHLLNEKIADKLLSNAANSALSTLSARTDMCYALGLITEVEYHECVLIRKVRNRFAHKLHGLTFQDSEIAGWCTSLQAMAYERWGSPRQRYINSVITLCMVLWHRPSHAVHLRAQVRQWPWHLAFGDSNKKG